MGRVPRGGSPAPLASLPPRLGCSLGGPVPGHRPPLGVGAVREGARSPASSSEVWRAGRGSGPAPPRPALLPRAASQPRGGRGAPAARPAGCFRGRSLSESRRGGHLVAGSPPPWTRVPSRAAVGDRPEGQSVSKTPPGRGSTLQSPPGHVGPDVAAERPERGMGAGSRGAEDAQSDLRSHASVACIVPTFTILGPHLLSEELGQVISHRGLEPEGGLRSGGHLRVTGRVCSRGHT